VSFDREKLVKETASRVASNFRIVMPKRVRDRLGLKPGDLVRYVVEGNRVVIECAKTEAEDDPFATFSEWSSKADEDAYGSLSTSWFDKLTMRKSNQTPHPASSSSVLILSLSKDEESQKGIQCHSRRSMSWSCRFPMPIVSRRNAAPPS
jgi:antitoxin PrlF